MQPSLSICAWSHRPPHRPHMVWGKAFLLILLAISALLLVPNLASADSLIPCGDRWQSRVVPELGRGSESPFADPCHEPAAVDESGLALAHITFADRDELGYLASTFDVWEVDRAAGRVLAWLTAAEREQLARLGYPLTVDRQRTDQIFATLPQARQQGSGIPGYACYRTVEETYRDLASLATDRPGLAEWIDIGDSYDKVTPDGPVGHDLFALVLTNETIPAAEKGKLLILAAVHARELATTELASRFAEMLIAGYGIDPDLTWLLDRNEIHIIPIGNPDGRIQAEAGYLWRKNTNSPDACRFPNYGVDLNRNASFLWNICQGGCSSSSPCSVTYRGLTPGSEPETQAIESYQQAVFADQRGDGIEDAAPEDTNGIFISLHSYGRLVIYTWDWTGTPAPNEDGMRRLGRKFGYFNRYSVCNTQNCLYPVDGSNTDFAYGELGVASYTFELGTSFFESCDYFEGSILQSNLAALVYAAKTARRPYQLPQGPDTIDVAIAPARVAAGVPLSLTAIVDGTRYFSNGFGDETIQAISAVRYSLHSPSWLTETVSLPVAADGAFDDVQEAISATIDTSGWSPGRHTLFVESQDGSGHWGPPTAVFVQIDSDFGLEIEQSPAVQGGTPGSTALFTVTVTNTSRAPDSFQATVEESRWPAALVQPVEATGGGETAPLQVEISVPESATSGDAGVTILRISSNGDPAQYRVATLQTVVTPVQITTHPQESTNLYLPAVSH